MSDRDPTTDPKRGDAWHRGLTEYRITGVQRSRIRHGKRTGVVMYKRYGFGTSTSGEPGTRLLEEWPWFVEGMTLVRKAK